MWYQRWRAFPSFLSVPLVGAAAGPLWFPCAALCFSMLVQLMGHRVCTAHLQLVGCIYVISLCGMKVLRLSRCLRCRHWSSLIWIWIELSSWSLVKSLPLRSTNILVPVGRKAIIRTPSVMWNCYNNILLASRSNCFLQIQEQRCRRTPCWLKNSKRAVDILMNISLFIQ